MKLSKFKYYNICRYPAHSQRCYKISSENSRIEFSERPSPRQKGVRMEPNSQVHTMSLEQFYRAQRLA